MEILDPGHCYKLATLDGSVSVILTFVKRNTPQEKYPGNSNAYPGTTLQEVLRCLIDRMRYLNIQKPSIFNLLIIHSLRLCIWRLERRAFLLKGLSLPLEMLLDIETRPVSEIDGHLILDTKKGFSEISEKP